MNYGPNSYELGTKSEIHNNVIYIHELIDWILKSNNRIHVCKPLRWVNQNEKYTRDWKLTCNYGKN